MITVILRTAIIFIFVTLAIRIMGKRQIGDMQPNELVITILLSEIAAIPLQDTTQPLLNGIIAIFVLVVLEILISVLALKSVWVRKIMNGQSVVIIKSLFNRRQLFTDGLETSEKKSIAIKLRNKLNK